MLNYIKLLYITNQISCPSKLEPALFIKCAFYNVLNDKYFLLSRKNAHHKKIIDNQMLNTTEFLNQEPTSGTFNNAQKFEIAETLLNKYAGAKLIIKSSIHSKLLYLAPGTPIIFVNGFNSFVDRCLLDGILELFNRIDINSKIKEHTSNFDLKGKIDENTEVKNLEKHHGITSTLKSRFKDLLNVL